MDLISIIVPVYKVEAYLDQCVQSIVDQTYKNLEIILVDDGSPDNCGAMCDAWAAKDSRIQVIHQENAGAGAARNAGFAVATGDWISYIDGDDWLALDMYERLYDRAIQTGSAIASCGMLRIWPEEGRTELIRQGAEAIVLDRSAAVKAMIQSTHLIMTPPNKLYHRSTVEGVPFPTGRTIDDEFWSWRVVANAHRVATILEPLYFYRQHAESVMNSKAQYHLLDVVDAKCRRQEYLEENMPELANDGCWNLLGTCLYQGQTMLRSFPYKEVKDQLSKIKRVVKKHAVDKAYFTKLSFKRKLRYLMIRHCFVLTCRIQNLFGIGL